ncbi:MAG: type II secretion system F family protein [Desulfuromonadales bacterium]
MNTYSYQAVDYSGQTVKGRIESTTVDAASRDLDAKGLYILSIHESTSYFSRFNGPWRAFQVRQSDIVEFSQSLSVMLDAGMPIIGCLDDIISSTPNPAFVPVLQDLRQRLLSGSSVSQALEAHGALFPEILRTLAAVGEETGTLVANLREASEHLLRMQKLKDGVKKALMYPLFAFMATIGALVFWLIFVIPNLSVTLKSMGVKLPLLTLGLIATSAWFQAHWKLLLLFVGLVPPLYFALCTNSRIRYLRDLALIKLPILKVILYNRLLATFSEQFKMMIAAGINIGRLFDLLIPSLGNEYFGANMRTVKDKILNGGRISDSFEQQNILPALVLSKIRLGETTGTLDNQFEFLAKYYTKKLDDTIDNLGKIIEPLVMVVIGGLFAIIIMGLLLPIYDLVSKVGKT